MPKLIKSVFYYIKCRKCYIKKIQKLYHKIDTNFLKSGVVNKIWRSASLSLSISRIIYRLRNGQRKVQSLDRRHEGKCNERTFLGCFSFRWFAVTPESTRIFWVGPLTGLHYDRGQKWPLNSISVHSGEWTANPRSNIHSRPRQGYGRSRITLRSLTFAVVLAFKVSRQTWSLRNGFN